VGAGVAAGGGCGLASGGFLPHALTAAATMINAAAPARNLEIITVISSE